MTYSETINYLYSAAPAFEKVGAGAYKEGLSTTKALDEHFGHPHQQFKTIHIAGTNGKGSCSHTLAAILQAAGYKVGLYTSPHLIDFRERIRINGKCIPEQYIVDFVEVERSFFEQFQPSFFELTTALAFKYFADEKVDVAVIEVGLGGRLDCTNIIRPMISLITNISPDHTQFLGSTLAEIATEKGGIIKEGVPCVIGEYVEETKPVFAHIADTVGAPITFAQDGDQSFDMEFQLKGDYQQKNSLTIITAIRQLQQLHHEDSIAQPFLITEEAVREGFAHVCDLTGMMGRWQKLSDKPLTICDAGHNIGGWQYLHKQIKDTFESLRATAREKDTENNVSLHIVFGMVDDKDIDAVMRLLPDYAQYYFCQASTKRALPAEEVQSKAKNCGLNGLTFSTVESAYHAALSNASDHDFIFIGGSCYILADLLTALRDKEEKAF